MRLHKWNNSHHRSGSRGSPWRPVEIPRSETHRLISESNRSGVIGGMRCPESPDALESGPSSKWHIVYIALSWQRSRVRAHSLGKSGGARLRITRADNTGSVQNKRPNSV